MIAFTCPKCRRELEFADEAAGSVVRCPGCRVKLRVPGGPPAELEREPEERPRPKKRRRRRPVEPEADPNEITPTPEWLAPTILLVVGLLLAVGSPALQKGAEGFAQGLAAVGFRLLFAVPLTVAALFISAPLLGIDFGPFSLAILKLSAINVLLVAIGLTVMMSSAAGGVGIIILLIAGPVGWMLFKWLFQLEFQEVMFVLVVIWLIQFLAGLAQTTMRLRSGG
jgi:hypothetical protein